MDAEQISREVAERVRTLVAEAEERAAQIVREAEQEAVRIRDRAELESRDRLEEVRRTLEELQSRLGAAGASTGAGAEIEPGPTPVPEPEPPLVPEPTPPSPDPSPEPPLIPEPAPPPDEGTPPQVAGNGDAPDAAAGSDDVAGARLVAMDMALEGASREQIEGHLAEHYTLDDVGALVDDVLVLTAK